MSTTEILTLLVRYGLVMLFLPFSALDKILDFHNAVNQAEEVFKPRAIAIAVLMCGFAIEVIMSLGIVTGFADRLAGLVMAAYCAATAILYKRFWTKGDFWTAGDSKGRAMFWDFLKNFSLGAGFLLIVIGTNGAGLAPFLAHPLASSNPYASSQDRP
jgi:putative oxidoreductase